MSEQSQTQEATREPEDLSVNLQGLPASFVTATTTGRARREGFATGAERTRQDSFGGLRLKLEVFGSIPGYHLYWANHQNSEVESLLQEGFELVRKDEVGMTERIVQDDDVSNCVSRYVGEAADGGPLRAFLLKLPEDMWKERESMRYRQADEWDTHIRTGRIAEVENRYNPMGHDIKLNTR